MQKQQYKRIYNLAFALLAVCSFFFVFKAAKSFFTASIIDAQKKQYSRMFERQRTFVYNQLVKAGKQEEADFFRRDPQANTLGILMTDDESGQPFGPKVNSLDHRTRFCEENLTAISIITSLLAYFVSYFAFWHIASLSVRYVKGQTDQQPVSVSK